MASKHVSSTMINTQAPFRFLDLPLEIRNQVYKYLLCTFHEKARSVIMSRTRLVHSDLKVTNVIRDAHPAILRTSRAIYKEARDFERKTNVYVRLVATESFFNEIVLPCGLPHFSTAYVKKIADRSWRGVALVHQVDEIQHDKSIDYKRINYLFLLRDQQLFVDCLDFCMDTVANCNDKYKNSIQLTCPYRHSITIQMWFTEELKRRLVGTYCQLFGWKHFAIEGVDQAFAARVIARVQRPRPIMKPFRLLQGIEASKQKGDAAYHLGNQDSASYYWNSALVLMQSETGESTRERICKAGGEEFVSAIASLEFALCSNMALLDMSRLKRHRARQGQQAKHDLCGALFRTVFYARQIPAKWRKFGSSWEIDTVQETKLLYQEAVALKLLGGIIHLTGAAGIIAEALEKDPCDLTLLMEKELIEKAIRAHCIQAEEGGST